MADITIYQKPTCSTCRQAVQLLKECGKPFTAVNYYEKPFTKAQLKGLLKKAGLSAKEVLRVSRGASPGRNSDSARASVLPRR